jgi:Tfp pilus assembly pilus retraction ATPase PilT
MTTPYITEAVEKGASDILLIQNSIWYRIQGQLHKSIHSTETLDDTPHPNIERKSATHLRCIQNFLAQPNLPLNYPKESKDILTGKKNGLILVGGPSASGKTTLALHLLHAMNHHSVQVSSFSKHLYPNVLLSNDAPNIIHMKIHDAHTAMYALRSSIDSIVIADIHAKNAQDVMQQMQLLLKDYPEELILSLCAEQVQTIVTCALVQSISQKYRPLLTIIQTNESISAQIQQKAFHNLETYVQRGNAGAGSLSGDVQLAQWLQEKTITMDEAIRFAAQPATMRLRAAGIVHNE